MDDVLGELNELLNDPEALTEALAALVGSNTAALVLRDQGIGVWVPTFAAGTALILSTALLRRLGVGLVALSTGKILWNLTQGEAS